MSLALVANYTPAAAKVGDRRQHCSPQYDSQLWGGDLNGHMSADSPEPNCVGPFGIGSTGIWAFCGVEGYRGNFGSVSCLYLACGQDRE